MFFCERIHAQLVEQRAIALRIGIAGRQQLLAVEDRIRAGEEAQRLNRIGHLLASAESRTRAVGIVMRATAMVRTKSSGSSSSVCASAYLPP